jgi:hypothetical protein
MFLLDALLERLAGLGLVEAGGRQRTDSTHVLGAIRALSRLAPASISRSATELPGAASGRSHVHRLRYAESSFANPANEMPLPRDLKRR